MEMLKGLLFVTLGMIIALLPAAIIGFIAGLIVRQKYKIVGAAAPIAVWLVFACVIGPSKMLSLQGDMLNSTLGLIIGLVLYAVAGSIGGDWAKWFMERKRSGASK
jgi:hypothetical protein